MKFNIYRMLTYIVLAAFFTLTTLQTLFDIQDYFNIGLDVSVFIYSTLISIIPIAFLIFVMRFVSSKTRYYKLFVIKEIKSLIRMLFYSVLIFIFIFWSIGLIFMIGVSFDKAIELQIFAGFIANKALFSLLYALIVAAFFNSISNIEFKSKKERS